MRYPLKNTAGCLMRIEREVGTGTPIDAAPYNLLTSVISRYRISLAQ